MNKKTFTTLFGFGILLRIAGLWIPQLWYDENFTLIVARLPFDRMMTAIAGDVHPPLWYLIEWTFLRIFPDTLAVPVWMIRIPALITSVLALWVFRKLLDELHIPARVQIGAMVLMTILPMQLWYGQEARMYSLLELEVLLALLFALRIQWMDMRFQWLGLLITSTAMLYTQNYSIFYIAAIGLVVLLKDLDFLNDQRLLGMHCGFWTTFKPTLKAAGAFLLAGLLYLPWIKVLANQMAYIGGRYWIQQPLIGDVLYTVYKLFWQSAMPDFALISGIMVTFAMLSIGILHLFKSYHFDAWKIFIMAFGPLALAWIISVIWNPILLHRALIGESPFLYIIVAWPLEALLEGNQIKSWRETVLAGALVIPIIVAGVGGYYKNIAGMKNDGAVSSLQDALIYVRAHWQPGDILYYTDDGPAVNLMPYTADLPQYGMSACGSDSYGLVLGSLNPRTRDAMGIVVRELDQIDYKRAWVFAPRSPLHPKCYEEHIAPFTQGDPLITVDNNEYIFSGVWLVEK